MNPFDFVTMILTLSWGSPIGLGFLLMGLGVFYWGRSLDKKSKQDDNAKKEKEL
jgi:hypothetical protein